MKAEFQPIYFVDGQEIPGEQKTVQLPFKRVSARAIVVRQRDGAVIGMLHHVGGKYALPGGAVDDGETTESALMRELTEENIQVQGLASDWPEKIVVDYFPGYRELNVWYVLEVEDAQFQENDEVVETNWVMPDQDIWYPFMREKITLALRQYQHTGGLDGMD